MSRKQVAVPLSVASRILRLVLLAPDIQEAILNSTYPATLTLADFMDPFP